MHACTKPLHAERLGYHNYIRKGLSVYWCIYRHIIMCDSCGFLYGVWDLMYQHSLCSNFCITQDLFLSLVAHEGSSIHGSLPSPPCLYRFGYLHNHALMITKWRGEALGMHIHKAWHQCKAVYEVLFSVGW